ESVLWEARTGHHRAGHPGRYSTRSFVNAVFYVLKTGCQWRQLPHEYPPWKAVHERLRRWRRLGLWETVLEQMRQQGRLKVGRTAQPSLAIIDSQSVKTAGKGGSAVMMQGRRSKAVSGTLRSIRKATCSP